MHRQQLIALTLCNLGIFVMGIMALGLLPVYAVQLGMDPGAIGLCLALAFAALTAGALASGWFSDRFQRRKGTIIVSAIIAIPATYLMGQVNTLIALTLVTLVVCFAGGLTTALISILAGMYANPSERGRIFGILGTSVPLANIIAGIASGAIADRWGFSVMYGVTALLWITAIIAALFLQDRQEVRLAAEQRQSAVPLSGVIWLLILASILVSIPGSSIGLARPLMMTQLNFGAGSISSATSISGLVSLPLPFLMGWLSDRVGRKRLLLANYLVVSLGMLVLIGAVNLWQFWLSASLIALAGGSGVLASALVTDLAPPQALGTALSRFAATAWIAGVIGYGTTGFLIESLGMSSALLINAALPVVALFALLAIRKSARSVPILGIVQDVPQEDQPAA